VLHVWIDPDAPKARIEQLIYERDLPREFPARVLAEADAAPETIPQDELARRRDLRNLEIVVIDPADARDHDDAVSWEPTRRAAGGWASTLRTCHGTSGPGRRWTARRTRAACRAT
jgi:exoribonuclease R